MKLLVRNGRIIDPARQLNRVADIWIDQGKIVAITPAAAVAAPDGGDLGPAPVLGAEKTDAGDPVGAEGTVAGGSIGADSAADAIGSVGAGLRPSGPASALPVLAASGDPAGYQVLEARGKLVVPGLIDMHVHLREPGFERKETIATGTRAAARGGFTSVACMPNTQPVADSRAVIDFIREQARITGVVNVYPIGAITKASKGEELAEMADLAAGGAVAFSDDGRPVMNAQVMRLALEYARIGDWPLIAHSEDLHLTGEGQMHEGYWSMLLGLPGIPSSSEEVMVARDIRLAEMTGSRLHVAHVSSAGTVELIRAAKQRGVKVTAEVTPHHLTLTDEIVAKSGFSTNTKVNPPLRSETDRQALLAGLADGTIEVIATDHAPHTLEEKDREYNFALCGISGLETAVPLLWTELIERGVLGVEQFVACLTTNPARILGLAKGSLDIGADADLTIIDPDLSQAVQVAEFVSLGKNSPFDGYNLKGWPVGTIVAGQVVMQDGRLRV